MLLRVSICSILFIVITAGYSCNWGLSMGVVINEVQRIPSNDHKVDAVLVTTDVDATTQTAYHLFIVKHGTKISKDRLNTSVFTCDHNSKLNLVWAGNKKLIISYDKARIFNYTNFWEDADVDNFKYVVEIFLNCKSVDHQLSNSDRNW